MDLDPITPLVEVGDRTSFRQKVLAAEKVFLDYGDGQSFAHRVNRELLRQLCEDRDLDTSGQKKELYARLVAWVSFAFSFP